MNDKVIFVKNISNQKRAKIFALIFTFLYAILFPLFLVFIPFVLSDSKYGILLGIAYKFLMCSIPILFILSIWNMWSKYAKEQYKKMCFYYSLPIIIIILISLIEIFNN